MSANYDQSEIVDESAIAEPCIEIHAEVTGALTYASWQNAVPLLRSIEVENRTEEGVSGLALEFETRPAFARSKRWTFDRLLPGETIAPGDRHVTLDPDYLAGLNEAERGVARFRLTDIDGSVLAEREIDIRLLARDEWGGFTTMPSLIAAFVTPNDAAVARILKEAGKLLGAHGHPTALDGYQTGDSQRAYMLAAAVWSAVAGHRLTYAEPPKSFEKNGQKVRPPSAVLEQGLATCLDTTLLFAAAIEAVGLNPAVLFTKGHSLVGVWLKRVTFPHLVVTDVSEVRKAIAAREFVTFETTYVTHTPPSTFDHAIATARALTSEREEDGFIAVVDIARARANQIRPLASHVATDGSGGGVGEGEDAALPLPPPPDFEDLPDDVVEVKPTTPAGRIERWQRKLLDLSLRNRLLNFVETKQTVPFHCPDVPYLEDRLADGARIRAISLPDQNPRGDRDETIHRQTTGQDFDTEFALQALNRDELCSPLEKRVLDARLTELYRRARSDLNEGGSNTLYLAVGFLRWKKTPEDERTYRAPLLLVPVKLERRSASSAFYLVLHEDEVRFNATLVQMLNRDFDLDLSYFEGELPADDSGVDIPLVLERMRRAVRDVPSFEVVNETALSTFSFAKYLMWKDLVERTDDLRKSRVVRHLIDNPDRPFEPGVETPFPSERDIDARYHPKEIVSPLPADSSQLAAVIAAAEGHDFVLIGPPGTGKSQTITNMIAQCLAAGKSVLFVAEKTAALNVVHRRLQEHGLGTFCLELHSSKAERKRFLSQLQSSWEAGSAASGDDWIAINEELRLHRDELNAYVEALHDVHPNGLSCFSALGLVCGNAESFAPALTFAEGTRHDPHAMDQMRRTVADLAVTRRAIRPLPSLALVEACDWSMRWQQEFISCCAELRAAAAELDSSRYRFMTALGLSAEREMGFSDLRDLSGMAKTILDVRGADLAVAFSQQFEELKASIGALEETIGQFHVAEGSLAAKYRDDDIRAMPIERLQNDWREADAALWPKSWLGRRRVRKLLQGYAQGGSADPACDLPALRVMQKSLAATDGNELGRYVPAWKGARTDIDDVRLQFDQGTALRDSLMRVGKLAENMGTVVRSVAECIGPTVGNHPLFEDARAFQAALAVLLEKANAFQSEGGTFLQDGDFLRTLIAGLDELGANASALQAWTEWRSVAERAGAYGLGSFVAALGDEHLHPDGAAAAFELSYARWWLPSAMDENPVLRQFKSFRHEEALRQFRELDTRAQAMAAAQVRRNMVRDLPRPQDVPRRSELGLLRFQMGLQRPSKSIREVIAAMPTTFGQLAPCVLMSPLSIAQYLPANQEQFDVVIFDEASQITTWDAVGSIARAKQAIIVGDPKQLPPTNFFGRSNDGDGDGDADDGYGFLDRDLESILDEATVSGLPVKWLNWHYRSRHESLISFSNWHYYNNGLVTFPSPNTVDTGVSLTYLPNAVYDRGKSRTNRIEAEAIVRDACERMRDWLGLPEDHRPTLGVITFNAQQQSLIQDLFDAELRAEPDLEWFFSDDRFEPTMVRNLENVQGDERDVMYFSITFGPDHAGKRTVSFGAINEQGGERRLNVAVTRARRELRVYSSTKADHIDIGRTKALGVAHLKAFLDFADRGSVALAAETQGSVGEMESVFEEAVAEALSARGWVVVPQIGVSQYRIDLGIVHPEKPGAYLAGIECDGATYHRSATARDRDKVREEVLRGLGWSIRRIWSPDWWYDARAVADRVDADLRALLEESRKKDREADEEAREAQRRAREDKERRIHDRHADEANTDRASRDEDETESTGQGDETTMVDEAAGSQELTREGPLFRQADLTGFKVDPNRFYEASYSRTLGAMVEAILEAEAPVRDDILAKRIARAHGWLRTGTSIRSHIERHLRAVDASTEPDGRFLWRDGQRGGPVAYRHHATEEDRRPVAEIALEELAALVRENGDIVSADDPAIDFARRIGLSRLAAASRERLEAAIAVASEGMAEAEG